jgi:DNA-directed RNA polymerase specialized sigma24 family protein
MISRQHLDMELAKIGRFSRAVASRLSLSLYESDDLHADAMVFVWELADDYDDDTLADWRTAVKRRITRRARDMKRPRDESPEVTEDMVAPFGPAEIVEFWDTMSGLNPLDQILVHRRLWGYSEEEIAAEEGVDQSTISRRLTAIQKRLTA